MGEVLDTQRFADLRVAVVGDLIADRTLFTEPRGLSREAPVMVLRHKGEKLGAGGAANVARNLRALGAETLCLGAVGRDAAGRELCEILRGDSIDVERVLSVPGWFTPTKTRVVSAEPRRNPQQVLRIDVEPAGPLNEASRGRIARDVHALAGHVAALVVSDYEYGLVGADLGEAVQALLKRGVQVVLDPRAQLEGFEGVTALTPNLGELARFTGRRIEALGDAAALARAARELLERSRSRWLLVTRGNLGMVLYGEGCAPGGVAVEASGSGNVTDVCGAGDTAAAVFALSLAAGLEPVRAMQAANAASGVVVMENGAAVCTPEQLRAALALAPSPMVLARSAP